ncbi:MAG: response regulator [Lachnospiraceae bacterium]|nr:response regulator [Lachnospiraceae bacterium]
MTAVYWTAMIRKDQERTMNKWEILYVLPVATVIIMLFIFPIEYEDIGNWYYAKGPALIMLYIAISIYLLICLFELIRFWKNISRKNIIEYMFLWIFATVVILLQLFDRKDVVTSAAVVLLVLGIYMMAENPDLLLIERLNYEKERANIANNSKSSFIAHISHEIRTPINAIIGMNEMISRETKDDNTLSYSRDISAASHTLYGIINSVLDMSKMESGKMEIYPVKYSIDQMIHDTVSVYGPRAKAKDIDFIINVNPSIPRLLIGDDVRISQILANLISNAIKYTHEGFVQLDVDCEFQNNYVDLTFSVKDTGIGIKEEDVSKLFVAFERIEESRNRNIEGTGIGMNITNNLLRMMGSRLEVDSVYGEGSIFFFTIRQVIEDIEPVGDFVNALKDEIEDSGIDFVAPQASILVVDDNELNRKVFTSLLRETGIRIDEAENGRECLKKIIKNKYDIIFMDHMMPEMDGIETMHKMNEMKGNINENTPVVMLTANAISSIQDIYRQAGFAAYLSKPIFVSGLMRTIKSLLDSDKVISRDNRIKIAENLGKNWKDELPVIRGIDWNDAVKHLPTEDVLKATVKEFHKSIKQEAEILDRCYVDLNSGNNLELFRIKLHALKSSAAVIGAEMLSFGASEIEEAAKVGDIEVIREKYPFMINYYRTFEERLHMFDDGEKSKSENIDFPQVIALVQIVFLEMEEMNRPAANDALDEIENYKYPDQIQQSIGEMRKAVEEYDMDKISAVKNILLDELRTYRQMVEG